MTRNLQGNLFVKGFSIRKKLFLVSLSLIIIPIFGYRYVQDMETFLQKGQEDLLIENARIVAAILQDKKALFSQSIDKGLGHLFVRPLLSSIDLDGYASDWEIYAKRVQTYQIDPKKGPPLSLKFSIGNHGRNIYALLQITDDKVIFRKPNTQRVDQNDHLLILMENPRGKLEKYIISTYSPGLVYAHRMSNNPRRYNPIKIDRRIRAAWQNTKIGYDIELRIPISMLGAKIAFVIADVDDPLNGKIALKLSTAGSKKSNKLPTVVLSSSKINQLLQRLERSSSRIWVIDKAAGIVAMTGHLLKDDNDDELLETTQDEELSLGEMTSGILRLLYQLILKQPATEFQDDLSNVSRLKGPEIDDALHGKSATHWRLTPDKQINILTATYPVIIKGEILGAVVIEKTSNSILLLQNRAIEILINLSMMAFTVATIVLLTFATIISLRIRRLRDDAENAITADGRVVGTVKSSDASDEIGDLARSYASILDRLAQYNAYLETMASKLSHELRTPITVIRSSLENLESDQLNKNDPLSKQSRTFTKRAQEGVERLSKILTRMSEATRIEQTLQQEERSIFDIEDVINSCVSGYQIAKPKINYQFEVKKEFDNQKLLVNGVPDLIAQLLDKLVSNATDFSKSNKPIIIRIESNSAHVTLNVLNEGPPLPESMQQNLFGSMVSVREKKGEEPHLGLGLYIVRLITEFHQGHASATNRTGTDGVQFSVQLPLS